jgi:hypothetical protein
MIRKKLVNPAGVPKNGIQIGKQRKKRTHTRPTLQVSQKEKKKRKRCANPASVPREEESKRTIGDPANP